MKKKVIVLGALGMAGHIMSQYLDETNEYQVYGIARTKDTKYIKKELDAQNFEDLEKYIQEIRPNFVINCIGILVAKSNNDLTTAIMMNSYLPHFLSKLGDKLNYKLVHISTDCVFSGKTGSYKEDSFRDGDDNYARTKALGEVINDKDLTIRTSIIGPELKPNGTGLLHWFLNQNSTISGYTKAFWSGVTTLELAKQTHEMIKQDIKGLFQLCPDDRISKFNLLKLFAKIWNKEIIIEENSKYNVDKSLICTRTDFIYVNNKRPNFEQMLLDTKNWMYKNKDYYQHYNL